MDFPDKLDLEDMELALKEWKLAGLHTLGPVEGDDIQRNLVMFIAVGEIRPKDDLMGWYWFTRYDLRDDTWVKVIDKEHH